MKSRSRRGQRRPRAPHGVPGAWTGRRAEEETAGGRAGQVGARRGEAASSGRASGRAGSSASAARRPWGAAREGGGERGGGGARGGGRGREGRAAAAPPPVPPPPGEGGLPGEGGAGASTQGARGSALRGCAPGPSARCGCLQSAHARPPPPRRIYAPSGGLGVTLTCGHCQPPRCSAQAPRASFHHGSALLCGVPALQAGPLRTKAPKGLRPLLPFLRCQIPALTPLADPLYRRPNLLLLPLAARSGSGGQFLLLT